MLQFASGTDFLMGCCKTKWEVFLVEERKSIIGLVYFRMRGTDCPTVPWLLYFKSRGCLLLLSSAASVIQGAMTAMQVCAALNAAVVATDYDLG